MTYLFQRPKEPRELSQDKIRRKLEAGALLFCGGCNRELVIDRQTGIATLCNCRPLNINTVSSLRIIDDRIVTDTIDMPNDKDFDPTIYAPVQSNQRRVSRWYSRKRK